MSVLSKVKDIIAGVAPTLGTALGGPLGGIAGTFIQQALGVDSEEAALQKLQSDPAALLELKTKEMEFKKWMRDADIKEEQLSVQDRGSARELARRKGMLPQVILSTVYTFGYFGVLIGVMTNTLVIPVGSEGALFSGVIGVLTAGQIQIMNFWFGSSSGSKDKTIDLQHS